MVLTFKVKRELESELVMRGRVSAKNLGEAVITTLDRERREGKGESSVKKARQKEKTWK